MKQKIPERLKNKYVIAILVFIVWVFFFDRNSMLTQFRLIKNLNHLEAEKDYYISEIESDSATLNLLESDQDALEKFARENYLMKKDSEDLFLITEED